MVVAQTWQKRTPDPRCLRWITASGWRTHVASRRVPRRAVSPEVEPQATGPVSPANGDLAHKSGEEKLDVVVHVLSSPVAVCRTAETLNLA